MTFVIAWVAFPALLVVLAWGSGLLIVRTAGGRLPNGALLPAGLALVIAAGLFPPTIPGGARFATPLVLVLALTGFALGSPIRVRIDQWATAAGAGTYLVFGAPVIVCGRATFAGYIKLDDTATYLGMLDRFMGHGYDVSGLAPSTYEAMLNTSLAYGYPMGSLIPLGIGHALVRTDTAWLWQPYLSLLAAMIGLALYALLEPLVDARPLRALAAFVAAQSALLYGYAQWGGIKELAAAALLALGAALLPGLLATGSWRGAIPLAVTVSALLGALSGGGLIWLAPVAGVGFVLVALCRDRRLAIVATTLVALTVLGSAPAISAGRTWLSHSSGFEKGNEFANLGHALSALQLAGIWPAGDFRDPPAELTLTHVLIALVALAAAAGLVIASRRHAWGVLAYAASALGGAAIFEAIGSPWIAGKGLASASPVLLALGLGALCSASRTGYRAILLALALPLVAGVIWSNVLAYHDVWLAPNARLGELETIGSRFAGEGPTLMTEFEPYGVRHFLRTLEPEGASELRRSPDPLANGEELETGDSADVDEFALATLLPYRTLVLRRSPAGSIPPSAFRLVWQGRYYDVWQQTPGSSASIVEHVSLGDRFHAAAVPSCATVLSVARAAGRGGTLATVERPANAAISLTGASRFAYGQYGERTDTLYLTAPRSWQEQVLVRRGGLVDIGVDGTLQGDAVVSVDGRRVGSVRSTLNWPNEYQQIATLELPAGRHTVTLDYLGASWLPGTAGTPAFGAGPLLVGLDPAEATVTTLPAAQARSLCGKSLDWIEALRG